MADFIKQIRNDLAKLATRHKTRQGPFVFDQEDLPKAYLIEKNGLYYRPNSGGYTGLKSEAGRYSFDEAAAIVRRHGPDGPRDGMAMWLECDAPEYAPRCAWDVKMKDQAYKQGWADAIAFVNDERSA